VGGGGGGLGLQKGKEEGQMSDLVECKWKQATLVPYDEPLGLVVSCTFTFKVFIIPVIMFHWNRLM